MTMKNSEQETSKQVSKKVLREWEKDKLLLRG